jgi:hypothetical protein
LLQGGKQLHALGFGTSNQYGTSIRVAMLGSTKESLTLIAPAPHKPKKPRAHEKREDEHEEEEWIDDRSHRSWAGYRAGFVTLATIAAIALLVSGLPCPRQKYPYNRKISCLIRFDF